MVGKGRQSAYCFFCACAKHRHVVVCGFEKKFKMVTKQHAETRRIVSCANRLLKRELILLAIHPPNGMYSFIGTSIFVCARSVVLCKLFT